MATPARPPGRSSPGRASSCSPPRSTPTSSNGRAPCTRAATSPRGSGGKAHVLLFEDRRPTPDARSDELRVYEERGNALKLALRFRPEGPRAVFAYRATTDVDFDGADEVVGGYGYPTSRQAMVPFA